MTLMARVVYDFATDVAYESRNKNIAKVVRTESNQTRTPQIRTFGFSFRYLS